MRIKTFAVPTSDPDEAEKAVNAFLSGHRVLKITPGFAADGPNSRWCLLVEYLEGPAQNRKTAAAQARIDYRSVLDEDAFARFCALRKARKAVAGAEGVPAFALFTDRQMADLAGFEVLRLADMDKVKGLGRAKIEKYGPAILLRLREDSAGEKDADKDETGREPV